MGDVQALSGTLVTDERDPWDQLAGEPDNAYRAFIAYRDHPTRKMRHVLNVLLTEAPESVAERTLITWRLQYNWIERAQAWTHLLQRQGDMARIQAVEDMNRRQVTSARLAQAVGTQKMKQMLEDVDQIKTMNPQTGGQLLQIGAQIERAALGMHEGRDTRPTLGITVVINMPTPDQDTIEGTVVDG